MAADGRNGATSLLALPWLARRARQTVRPARGAVGARGAEPRAQPVCEPVPQSVPTLASCPQWPHAIALKLAAEHRLIQYPWA